MSIRFDDALTTRGTGDVSDAEAWFDRAYFNIFAGIERPAVVLGGAHHPNADRGRGVSDGYIVVLHEGRVESQGKFDELLETSEEMRRLWRGEA